MRKATLLIWLIVVSVAGLARGQARKQINDPAEYNAYMSALGQTDPAAKIDGLEAFLTQYPDSVMREDSLELLMAAYERAGNTAKSQDTAKKVLEINACNLRALALLASMGQGVGQPGGRWASLAQSITETGQYAEIGLRCEATATKPEGVTQADFDRLKSQTAMIFNETSGVLAYQAKDYAKAQKRLRAAVDAEPNNFVNVYALAQAYLEPGPTEKDVDGLFYIARSANLAQSENKDQIVKYGKSRYTKYHGSDEGWNELMAVAATATSPNGKEAGQNAVATAGVITRIEENGGTKNGGTGGDNRTAGGTARQPAGTRSVSLKGGGSASIRSNGQIGSVNSNGIQISRGVHGGRTVFGMHHDARVVNTNRHGGYVQRAYVTRGGRSYYSRTYYSHGEYRSVVYREYRWHGHNYYGYYPRHWYRPAFYGWAHKPWPAPVYWSVGAWGWGGHWWGSYARWWNPYPRYGGPASWLTDYIIAQQLQAAYAAQEETDADAGAGDPPPADTDGGQFALTPEVKQAIADEVTAEVEDQQAQAGEDGGGEAQAPVPANGEVPPALDPARRTFVVDRALTVVSNRQECGLTEGDVLTRLTDTPDADNMVNASVSASKANDCAAGRSIYVNVDDLQEMQNHFAELLDNGLDELANKQGTGGMPKAPDTTATTPNVPLPPPDRSASKTLEDQEQTANQTENQVRQEVAN